MAEDWDLYALVRSCTSVTNTATNTNTTQNTCTNFEDSNNSENPLACLASLTFEDDDPFCFPNLEHHNNNGFGELEDSYKAFLLTPTPTPITITNSQGIIPSSSDSDLGGLKDTQPQQLQPAKTSISFPFNNPTSPIFAFGESNNQQQQPQLVQQLQQQQNQQVQVQKQAGTSSALPLRTMQSQAPRSRKRKSQQKRMVCQVTADNLSSDLWAWRKYGQKPIKGSPYPRNYYRCSSSKGCVARKQVERSNTDANSFIVTYTGDHTHPRPTHRNSLAGSTRNKLSTIQEPERKDSAQLTIANASCSSPLSATSLSPTPSLPAPTEEEETMNDGGDHDKESQEMVDEDDEDDDILIPNMAMNEDFFLGLQEIGNSSVAGAGAGSSGGLRKSPAFGDNFSSWGPGSSAATGATAGGGC